MSHHLGLRYSDHGQPGSVQLNLSPVFDVKAASTGFDDPLANFDGNGNSYPVEWLPTGDSYNYLGIQFALPPFHEPQTYDTVGAKSQVLSVPQGTYQSFHSLMTWTGSGAKAIELQFGFEDGTSETAGLIIGSWWSQNPFDGPIRTPYHYEPGTKNYNITEIQYATTRISNSKNLTSITVPAVDQNVRIFSVSLVPTPALPPVENTTSLRIENVRSTTKWFKTDQKAVVQEIEITVSNVASLSAGVESWITSPISVHLSSSAVNTVIPATIKRLRSNDQTVLIVGITNSISGAIGSTATVQVRISDQEGQPILPLNGDVDWAITAGVPQWQSNDDSLATHEAPDWFDDAKFGIFIHYGLYSVPAWAPSGKQYAEWYNWDFHNPPGDTPTRTHHLATYGPNVTYDDFLGNWTASKWNPDDWTDLFADSGAKYFVLVTKHHDGVVLFDTNSTDRNSVKLGPKRDFLKELFDSAKSRHPELHRGTYFSLPEWFNPAYQPHGKPSFPGEPALNAITGECCDPYTGYIPVTDFLEEVQKPQMESLFYEYDTEILWCDIGFDSIFPKIGADWYNYAASQGRQVVMNNRCGANQSDFVTPEYATFDSPLTQKWESSAGMDPFSYGYNSDTPTENYLNASSIILELVDIVSKGGNFLLDIGPKEDGTVIAAMTEPLLQVGTWLKTSGEAIYGTRPWWFQPQDTTLTDVRFTTTTDAFYIIALSKPSGGLKVTAPVPIVSGDEVTLLGSSGDVLTWSSDNGTLTVQISDEDLDKVTLPAWAFKISYAT